MAFDAGMDPERQAYADRVLDLLEQARECCNGTHTMKDIREQIQAGRLELWIAEDGRAVAVTEFGDYPTGKVLNIFLSAGPADELNKCLPGLEAYARGKGAKAVMFYGRVTTKAAWTNLLPGYRPVWVCMWKDL